MYGYGRFACLSPTFGNVQYKFTLVILAIFIVDVNFGCFFYNGILLYYIKAVL